MKQPRIENLLPLREPTYFILLSLAETQKHGYAILQDVETLSQGKVSLSNGTLYGALTRLQDQGLIERIPATRPSANQDTPGRPRKEYRLTDNGLRLLRAEIERLSDLVAAARRQMPEGAK